MKQYLISTIVNSVYYSRLRFRILRSQEIKIKPQNSVETQAIFPSKKFFLAIVAKTYAKAVIKVSWSCPICLAFLFLAKYFVTDCL